MRIIKLLVLACLLVGCSDESMISNRDSVVNNEAQVRQNVELQVEENDVNQIEENKVINIETSPINDVRFEGVSNLNKFNNIRGNYIVALEDSYIVRFHQYDNIFESLNVGAYDWVYHLTMDSEITSLEPIAEYEGYDLCENDRGIFFYDMYDWSNNRRIIHLDKSSLKVKNIYNLDDDVWGLNCTQNKLIFMTGEMFGLKSLKVMNIDTGVTEVFVTDEIVIDYQVTEKGLYCLVDKDEAFQLILVTNVESKPMQLYEFDSKPEQIYSLLENKLLVQLSGSNALSSSFVILNDDLEITEVINDKSIIFVGYDNNSLFFIEQTGAYLGPPNIVHKYNVNEQTMEQYEDNVISIQYSNNKYFVRKYLGEYDKDSGEIEFETFIVDELGY